MSNKKTYITIAVPAHNRSPCNKPTACRALFNVIANEREQIINQEINNCIENNCICTWLAPQPKLTSYSYMFIEIPSTLNPSERTAVTTLVNMYFQR
jgi:hypothetical protein